MAPRSSSARRPVTSDQALLGLSLLEISRRCSADGLGDFLSLMQEGCEHIGACVFLSGLLIEICQQKGVDLDNLIAAYRSKALADDQIGGMA
jgi:hypothetical protein